MADQFINSLANKIQKFTARVKRYINKRRMASLKPEKPSQGNILLSYIIDPFLLKPGQPISNKHQNHWETLQIAKIWQEFGYSVDVISYLNDTFVPQKDYSFFIDVRQNLQKISPLLNKDCVKIFHVDIAHILFNSYAELERLLALQQRRGVTLRPRRVEIPNHGIESADFAVIKGNDWTISTFSYAKKPIYRLPTSSEFLIPWLEDKDFEACRKNFLWFGSNALVHKGLDLVLEAFAEMPEYHLTICGPIKKEEDFENAFYKELYQTPNIHTIGWVDISSSKFIEIINSCVGLIYASCSEGQSGSVLTGLQGGLIPIISRECGVDVSDEFGVILKNCSIEEIKNSVEKIANLPVEELKQMSRKAWEFARKNHTREKFVQEYRNIVEKIISNSRKSIAKLTDTNIDNG